MPGGKAKDGEGPEKAGGGHHGEGHRGRLRERFLAGGLAGFLDYEVIELLLTLGTPRQDCKQAAKDALLRFGSLQAVFEATPAELAQVKGIGLKNAFGVKLIQAVANRYLEQKAIGKDFIKNSKDLHDYLLHRFRDKKIESFVVVFLDNANAVLGVEALFEGTVNETAVYSRELVQAAIEKGAASILLAHNHPSGTLVPSQDDIAVTRKVLFACHAIDIQVLEHLIIGSGGTYSFREHGLIRHFTQEYEKSKTGEPWPPRRR
jgi:DNA repair protein RadC